MAEDYQKARGTQFFLAHCLAQRPRSPMAALPVARLVTKRSEAESARSATHLTIGRSHYSHYFVVMK
jgi:hypothetical protein